MTRWMSALAIAFLFGTVALAEDAKGDKAARGGDADAFFKKLDANGDGKVSKEEFKKFFEQMAEKIEKLKGKADFADKIFDKLDANGDGSLSKEEVKQLAERFGQFGGGQGKPGAGKGNPDGKGKPQLDPEKLKELRDKLKNGQLDPEKLKELVQKLKAKGQLDPEKLKELRDKLKKAQESKK